MNKFKAAISKVSMKGDVKVLADALLESGVFEGTFTQKAIDGFTQYVVAPAINGMVNLVKQTSAAIKEFWNLPWDQKKERIVNLFKSLWAKIKEIGEGIRKGGAKALNASIAGVQKAGVAMSELGDGAKKLVRKAGQKMAGVGLTDSEISAQQSKFSEIERVKAEARKSESATQKSAIKASKTKRAQQWGIE